MHVAVADQADARLTIKDAPELTPGEGDVVIKVEAAGVCFTDLRILDRRDAASPPLIPGHEPVGTVSHVGTGVTGFALGDRVGVHAFFGCGVCAYCRAGEEEACETGRLVGAALPGAYADYLRAPASQLIPIPAGLSAVDAAPFFCAGLTTYSGFKNAGLQPGQRVVVIGIGGLGHLAISIARAMGAEVYAVTGSPDKVAFARKRGAIFAADGESVAREVAARGGAHVAMNTADTLDPVGVILPGMAKQGTIVLLSADGEVMPIPPSMYIRRQLRVMGSFFGSRQDLRDVLDLAVREQIRPVVESYPLAEVNDVHRRLRANQVRYRAVLVP